MRNHMVTRWGVVKFLFLAGFLDRKGKAPSYPRGAKRKTVHFPRRVGPCPSIWEPLPGMAFQNLMDHPKFQQHGGPNPARRPYWKRLHHSPFFWVAASFIMAAMIIYIATGNLAFRPGRAPQAPVPAVTP